jgi:hypothetical protein
MKKGNGYQADLFDIPPAEELKNRIRELDRLISRSMKKGDFKTAKNLTDEQERLIKQLVSMDEGEASDSSDIS